MSWDRAMGSDRYRDREKSERDEKREKNRESVVI
jgi:hypothetical protein